MLCRMCLLESENALSIFEHNSVHFKIAPTIGRHFWFEPVKDDPISIMICITCWSKISDFHTYYLGVEEAQRLLTEFSSVKEESSYNVEQLKSEYVDEYVDKKDMSTVAGTDPAASNFPVSINFKGNPIKQTFNRKNYDEYEHLVNETVASNCPVFVDVDGDENYSDVDNPKKEIIVEGSYGDYQDDKDEGSGSCSSDEEPPSKKVDGKPEPEKTGRGRKIYSKNKPKTLNRNATNIRTEEGSAESSQLSVSMDSDRADDPPKKKPGRKKKSEVTNKSAYSKKSKEYDDEISQFMTLHCELCTTDCKTFADVVTHYRTTHNIRGYVVCCTTRKFYKRIILYDHIQKHKNPDTFKCNFCAKVYGNTYALRSHLLTHDDSLQKSYQCDKCPRQFAKRFRLNQHKITHIPKEEHSISCDICGKSFPSKNTMETHRKSRHEMAYSKMCHICGKVINGKSLFAMHQLEHNGIADPKMQCEQCGMWLKNAYRLKVHVKRNHSEEKTGEHICNICGKILVSKCGLRSHIRYVHSTEPKHLCSVCDRGFQTPLSLKEHMTTHTGDDLYACPHCPKTFSMRSNMHSHRKKMHREEWEESRRSRGLPLNTKSKRGIRIIQQEDIRL